MASPGSGDALIHLVCDCGALVSSPPVPGPRTVPCRACGKVHEVPGEEALGLDPLPPAPPPDPGEPDSAAAPRAAPGPVVAPMPVFDADERLNLRILEREAARLLVMGRLVLAGGVLGAAAAAVVPGRTPAERALYAGAFLFASTAGWSGFRAARAACLASVALAQRQREILRSVAARG